MRVILIDGTQPLEPLGDILEIMLLTTIEGLRIAITNHIKVSILNIEVFLLGFGKKLEKGDN